MEKSKNIHLGHRGRKFDNFIRAGNLDGFSDIEIVEMVLFYSIPRRDTNEIAHKYINMAEKINNLFSNTPQYIEKVIGCSRKSAIILALMGKYYEVVYSENRLIFDKSIQIEQIENNIDEFYQKGNFEGIDDFNILLIYLYFSVQKKSNILNLAEKITDKIIVLRELFMMSGADIIGMFENCSKQMSCFISLPYEIENRFLLKGIENRKLVNSVEKAVDILKPYFYGRKTEFLYVMCLDNKSREIKTFCLSQGDDKHTIVPIDKLLKNIIDCNANKIIISHNHPEGSAELSVDDSITTRAVIAGLKMIQVKLVDHIIIAGDEYYSFAKEKIFGMG